jgi:hypothetical protein
VIRSIKPSRMSAAAGIVTSIILLVSGVGWIAFMLSMDQPGIAAVGCIFLLYGIVMLIFSAYNASVEAKRRIGFYDVVDGDDRAAPEEPFDKYCGKCGKGAGKSARFCEQCGGPLGV